MLKQLTKKVIKYPVIVIVTIIALTVFFYFGISKITMASELRDMLPENDPKVAAFDEVDAAFGGTGFVMILLDMGDIFTAKALHEIDRLTLDLEKINGVSRVTSITNVEDVRGVEHGIEVAEIIKEIPITESDIQKLKQRVLSDDDYAGQIVSKNGKIALVVVQLLTGIDRDTILQNIRKTISSLGLDEKAHLAGEDVTSQEVSSISRNDMSILLPLALLVMMGILFISFRNIRGIVLPVIIVMVTVIWIAGFMGYTGIPFTSISIIMPIVLISMGIADGIHILTRYREEISLGRDKRKSLIKTIVAVGLACFLTSITTMAGFGSLYVSSIRPIRDYGLLTAIGVGIAFIITITLFLALLSLSPPHRKKLNKKGKNLLQGILEKWSNVVVNRAKLILISACVLALITGAGISLIDTEAGMENLFNQDNSVTIARNIVDENFEGSEIIQIVIKGNIQDPEILQSMEAFENEISNINILGKPSSVVNILRNTNKALHEGKPEFEILSKTEEEAAQYFLLLEMGGTDTLDSFITFDYDQALIQARVEQSSDLEEDEMIEDVEAAINKHFPDDSDVVLTGMPVLTNTMSKLMVEGQLQSLAIAIFLIVVLMVILSRSFIYGMFCALPVSLTVILNFGIMGWFRIPLDIATALVSSIAIGIGVDYAIHFFNRYKEELAAGKSVQQAIKITISNTGQAIIFNAVAVGLGFLVLIFSSMPPLARFGYLIALTMFFSSAASMTLLPVLLLLRDRNKTINKKEIIR